MSKRRSSVVSYGIATGFLLVVGGAVWAGAIPALILWLYLAASCITFVAYAIDKRAARKGAWRTPESTLHLLALIGGWPGGLIARKRLRHKTQKQPFRAIFWGTVLLNCMAFAALFSPAAEGLWRSLEPVVEWGKDWLPR